MNPRHDSIPPGTAVRNTATNRAKLNNEYSFDVVAQEARAPTTKDSFSGALDLASTSDRICGAGEDYQSCVTMHGAMYNSLCVGDRPTLHP